MGPLYFTIGGTSWVVDRRREWRASRFLPGAPSEQLFLVFSGSTGEVRRGEIAESFPDDPSAELLASVWRNAEVIRASTPGEMQSRVGLVMPRWRDVARLTWRALRLRCPNCGTGHALRSWFHLRRACPVCGIRFDRGEDEDYFFGGMLFNAIVAEAILGITLAVGVAVMWPHVAWDDIEYGLLAAMVTVPIVFYPFSRLLWFALDLMLRPPDETEMRWHAAARRDHPEE